MFCPSKLVGTTDSSDSCNPRQLVCATNHWRVRAARRSAFDGVTRLGLGVDSGLLALRRRDRGRRRGQRVKAATGLRERDDVADRVGAAEQRADAVPAKSDPAVRGGAEGEGVQQEAELLLRLGLRQTHYLEDPLLDLPAVNTDRP